MIGSLWAKLGFGTNKRRDDLNLGRSLVVAALMVVLVVCASIVMTNHISNTERERCFDRLYTEAADIATFIENSIASDREELELLTAVVAQSDDFNAPHLWNLLTSFDHVGFMSQLALLMPDDTVIYGAGQTIDARGQLSFQKEMGHGVHVSHRGKSLLNPDEYVLRHYYPIKREGQVVAILYGVVMIQKLPLTMSIQPYSGKGAMYLIEGDTGDFLVDTWHPGQVGNLWELGTRPTAPGYDAAKFQRGFIKGESNYLVFVSRTIGEYLYFYYCPVGINEWRIALSIPESVVMANALHIEKIPCSHN